MAEVSRFNQLMDRAIFKPWGDFAAKHATLRKITNPAITGLGVTGLIGGLMNYASNFFYMDTLSISMLCAAMAVLLAKYGVSKSIDNAVLRDTVEKNADAQNEAHALAQHNSALMGDLAKIENQMRTLRGVVKNITPLTVNRKVFDEEKKEEVIKPFDEDFILLEQLGEGGFAIVRRVTNLNKDRTEVMKIAHSQFASDPTFRGRFSDEVRILMRLDHPNVVKILGSGEMEVVVSRNIKKVVPFYMMEPISGSPLSSILKTMRLELSEKTIELMLRMARTVKYFHEMGIIHRDIKPSNIFITDSEELVQFIDFGIAKDTEEERARTLAGEMAGGTQEYMPKEQYLGTPLDIRADLYALGATFFEMLTGTPPYPAAYLPTEKRFEKHLEYFARLSQKDWSDVTFSRINLSQLIKDLPKQNLQHIFQFLFKNPQQEQMLLKVANNQMEATLEDMVNKRFLSHEQRVYLLDGIRRIQYAKIPKIELHLMKGGATPHYKEMLQLLQDIFNKMLHGDKDYRYASDDELVSDLEALRGMMRNFDATVAPSRQ